jgi:hypothetical protein
MNKKYCIDCGELLGAYIPLFSDLAPNLKINGVEYKDGYRCMECSKKFKKYGDKK